MKTREELMEKIKSLDNPDIRIDTYTGFSYLHIDLFVNNKPALWCAISCEENIEDNQELDLKISDINDIVFLYDKKAKEIIIKLIKICKEIGVNKIYGRIAIVEKYDVIKRFYEDLGFSIIHTPREKNYDSAKITMIL